MAEKKNKIRGEYGEGNYKATRNFDRAEEQFVKTHRDEIPRKGEEAKHALEGKEGEELRRAEEIAKSHSHAKEPERWAARSPRHSRRGPKGTKLL